MAFFKMIKGRLVAACASGVIYLTQFDIRSLVLGVATGARNLVLHGRTCVLRILRFFYIVGAHCWPLKAVTFNAFATGVTGAKR